VHEVFYRNGLPEEMRKRAMTDWPFRLHHTENYDLFELYDLEADRGETAEIGADRPEVVRRLREALARWVEENLASAQMERIARALVSGRPAPAIPLDATLGDRVRVLGLDLHPPTAGPGQRVRLVWYFECLEEMSEPYRVFVHLSVPGPDGELRKVAGADHDPAAGAFPTDLWRKGNIIRDEHEVDLPRFAGKAVVVHVGMYRKADRLTAEGRDAEADDRVRAATLPPGR
jgi:hypothetical protein